MLTTRRKQARLPFVLQSIVWLPVTPERGGVSYRKAALSASMTARDLINRRWGKMALVRYLAIALFIGAMITVSRPGLQVWAPWALIVMVIALLAMTAVFNMSCRCPDCGGSITHLVMQNFGFRLSPSIRFCPYCGISFDAERDAMRDDG